MLFSFLKYLQPTQYFQSYNKFGTTVFPKVENLPETILSQLQLDSDFQSDLAKDYDRSWQAIIKGYISDVAAYEHFEPLSARDNYHFIRKYFHPAWVLYVLVLRLLSFKNPYKEFSGWYKTRAITQVAICPINIYKDPYERFESSLLRRRPKVSVVIPTLNRYKFLKAVLKDLEAQDYKNFEVLVVDQSDHYNRNFYKDFTLDLHVIQQIEKALWLARNTAINHAQGELIALSEDDVRIAPDWISTHLKCLDFFNAQVSAGVFYPEGQQLPKSRSYFAVASQFATGNAMLYKSVFKQIGLFDRQFEKQRMGDGEFGMRVYLEGIISISNPYAYCIDVKAGTGGLREMGSWDAFRPTHWLAPRPIPSVLYYYRRYFGNKAAKLALLRTVPFSVVPYQFKKNRALLLLGLLISVLLLPLVGYQVYKSWRMSTEKLKKGPLIDRLL